MTRKNSSNSPKSPNQTSSANPTTNPMARSYTHGPLFTAQTDIGAYTSHHYPGVGVGGPTGPLSSAASVHPHHPHHHHHLINHTTSVGAMPMATMSGYEQPVTPMAGGPGLQSTMSSYNPLLHGQTQSVYDVNHHHHHHLASGYIPGIGIAAASNPAVISANKRDSSKSSNNKSQNGQQNGQNHNGQNEKGSLNTSSNNIRPNSEEHAKQDTDDDDDKDNIDDDYVMPLKTQSVLPGIGTGGGGDRGGGYSYSNESNKGTTPFARSITLDPNRTTPSYYSSSHHHQAGSGGNQRQPGLERASSSTASVGNKKNSSNSTNSLNGNNNNIQKQNSNSNDNLLQNQRTSNSGNSNGSGSSSNRHSQGLGGRKKSAKSEDNINALSKGNNNNNYQENQHMNQSSKPQTAAPPPVHHQINQNLQLTQSQIKEQQLHLQTQATLAQLTANQQAQQAAAALNQQAQHQQQQVLIPQYVIGANGIATTMMMPLHTTGLLPVPGALLPGQLPIQVNPTMNPTGPLSLSPQPQNQNNLNTMNIGVAGGGISPNALLGQQNQLNALNMNVNALQPNLTNLNMPMVNQQAVTQQQQNLVANLTNQLNVGANAAVGSGGGNMNNPNLLQNQNSSGQNNQQNHKDLAKLRKEVRPWSMGDFSELEIHEALQQNQETKNNTEINKQSSKTNNNNNNSKNSGTNQNGQNQNQNVTPGNKFTNSQQQADKEVHSFHLQQAYYDGFNQFNREKDAAVQQAQAVTVSAYPAYHHGHAQGNHANHHHHHYGNQHHYGGQHHGHGKGGGHGHNQSHHGPGPQHLHHHGQGHHHGQFYGTTAATGHYGAYGAPHYGSAYPMSLVGPGPQGSNLDPNSNMNKMNNNVNFQKFNSMNQNPNDYDPNSQNNGQNNNQNAANLKTIGNRGSTAINERYRTNNNWGYSGKQVYARHVANVDDTAVGNGGDINSTERESARDKGWCLYDEWEIELGEMKWHEEALRMGTLWKNESIFVKGPEYNDLLSTLSERDIRHGGIHRYCLKFRESPLTRKDVGDGHDNQELPKQSMEGFSMADGVGFVFSNKLPCAKNIQRIQSVFVSRKGIVCIRRKTDVTRCKDFTLRAFNDGDYIFCQIDLDNGRAAFWLEPPESNGATRGPPKGSVFDYSQCFPQFNQGKLDMGFITSVIKFEGVSTEACRYEMIRAKNKGGENQFQMQNQNFQGHNNDSQQGFGGEVYNMNQNQNDSNMMQNQNQNIDNDMNQNQNQNQNEETLKSAKISNESEQHRSPERTADQSESSGNTAGA